jgi:LysM repeat protein
MSGYKKYSNLFIAMLMLFAMLAAAVQPAAAASQAATCQRWHTVVRGEYLSMIARMYDTDWRTLAELNDIDSPYTIYPGQRLCVSTTNSGSGSGGTDTDGNPPPSSGSSVRIFAERVQEDSYVTLIGKRLLANARYTVYLSKYSGFSSGAYLVGSVTTDRNGSFEHIFRIPGRLNDIPKIYAHAKSGTDLVSNWFINADVEDNTGGVGAPEMVLSIVSVKEDDTVKIKVTNMPANVTFDVTIGKAGSKGLKGHEVGELRDDDGGTLQGTFEIPSDYEGRAELDIRIENKALGLVIYTTFDND